MSDETDQDKLADEWAAAMGEAEEAGSGAGEGQVDPAPNEPAAQAGPAGKAKPRVAAAQFDELTDDAGSLGDEEANLDVILDIPVTLSMEIGRTRINIRNLLQLNQGSVVELDRLAGEPLDVLVNGTLIAHGEVVVVNERFGIRLTDVVTPAERVKKLT
ncbi:flagellar motor switch protein FliN [Alkalilimnicola sp. S0819]|uniref:flagellar motor switch protein FliN n=1 Tax=Alkalilimnicola sp. S0819 TaxID=2613922 RepID=UPI0012618F1E|nr:flagellar motor switch protein FliN [Alkalilimnicola sp. S0819]KAB7627174.1 flagellar motor switch protein FliN [Alkalilimnicola sp. S0819]MPQ15886.1 flagellar motor switch protein FliN [Alkalilimnicola sp. S0819]